MGLTTKMANHTMGNTSDLRFFLEQTDIFSAVPSVYINDILKMFDTVRLNKGETVFREGDPGNAMYIINTGSVGIYVQKSDTDLFISDLHRGDFFGEMALMTDLPRSATIKVILDTVLYRLEKENFNKILTKYPDIGLYLSRYYAHRIAEIYKQSKNEPLPTFHSFLESHPGLGRLYLVYSTAYHISEETAQKVLIIEIDDRNGVTGKYHLDEADCPNPKFIRPFRKRCAEVITRAWFSHTSGFMVLQIPGSSDQSFWQDINENLSEFMNLLRSEFDLVFFNIEKISGIIQKRIIRLSDRVLFIINNMNEAMPSVEKSLKEVRKRCGDGLSIVKVGVSHLAGKRGVPRKELQKTLALSEVPGIWVPRSGPSQNNEMDCEKVFPVKGPRALARELGGIRLGIALGAGAARGWAHLGVLKVLEEEGILIDMISGASMGALVGGVYARHASVKEACRCTIDRFSSRKDTRKKIFDYNLPTRGIIRGQKVIRLLKYAIGEADFLDLRIPAYFIAVDVLSGVENLLEHGDVCSAIRASISLPGIFNPFCHNGKWMVDGGLLNPIPTNVLVQKGADIIIAVCVEADAQTGKVQAPNIMQVLSRTINIVHSRVTGGVAQAADIVISPDVRGYSWDDFHRGHELMEVGEAACRAQLPEIKALIHKKIFEDRKK